LADTTDEIILLEKKISLDIDAKKKVYLDTTQALNIIRLLSLEDCPIAQCEACKAETLAKCKKRLGISNP